MAVPYQALLDEQAELLEVISESWAELMEENITRARIQTRIQANDTRWEKFKQNHGVLWELKYKLKADARAAFVECAYMKNKVYREAEKVYLSTLEKMLTLQDERFNLAPEVEDQLNRTGNRTGGNVHSSLLKLPKMEIPMFDGNFAQWINFRDMFVSLVVTNTSLTSVQRLYYLKNHLTGNAAKRIENLSLSGDNFQVAWDELMTFYDDTRALVSSYVGMLFGVAPMAHESAQELDRLYATITQALVALEALRRPVGQWDDLLIYIVMRKLDKESVKEWEKELGSSTEPPKFKDLKKFMLARTRSLQACQTDSTDFSLFSGPSVPDEPKVKARSHHVQSGNPSGSCSFCKGEHYIVSCPQYQQLTVKQRFEQVKRLRLCFNCLGQHPARDCQSSGRCATCRGRHNTSIHFDSTPTELPAQSHTVTETPTDSPPVTSHSVVQGQSAQVPVALLATALVRIRSSSGELYEARALIDQGSQVSLVSERLAQLLRLPRRHTRREIIGVGGVKCQVSHGMIMLEVFSRWGSFVTKAEAMILPRVSDYVPEVEKSFCWRYLDGLTLADPQFNETRSIDLIFGVGVFTKILQSGLIKGEAHEPVAQQTSLGWILSGNVVAPEAHEGGSCSSFHVSVDRGLNELVKKFWLQEDFFGDSVESAEDCQCEEYFKSTCERNKEGRYVVRLPFKSSSSQLGDSRPIAMKMLNRMVQRFNKDEDLRRQYSEFLAEYESLGHMSRIEPPSPGATVYYLPHHAVVRESSITTKLRVVFNGSAASSSGVSLNDLLHEGPKLQVNIVDILSRWRRHRYVFSADVTKMFRQILIHPDDRDFQRILWIDLTGKIVEYQLNTVTYGTRSAPYLAIRSLQQLAYDAEERYSGAREVILQGTYVDDTYGGASTLEGCKRVMGQVNALFASGGFPLLKWNSNHPTLLSEIVEHSRDQTNVHLVDSQQAHRTLGLNWDSVSDHFFYVPKIAVDSQKGLTKRVILSKVAQLYDPLGWISPVIVRGKLIIQDTWRAKCGWDEVLSEDFVKRWTLYLKEMPDLGLIRVPRHLGTTDATVIVELHGFSDASLLAYGTVIYLRTIDKDGNIQVALVSSKSKLAPIQDTCKLKKKTSSKVTIPRLELTAASLLVRHAVTVRDALSLKNLSVFLWSDSLVSLYWIRSDPLKFQQFVNNRVQYIQEKLPEAKWRHVPGADNPADLVSRGASALTLARSNLWWSGPSWLMEDRSHWPSHILLSPGDVNLEERGVHVATAQVSQSKRWDLIDNYSPLKMLLAVTAWCRRIFSVYKIRRSQLEGSQEMKYRVLSASELEEARSYWIKQTQGEFFAKEIREIRQDGHVSSKSSLVRLAPVIDSQGILRLRGRLQKSYLDSEAKQPIVLPRDSRYTELVLQETHERTLHGGAQLMLSTLRSKYWVIGGRQPVKSYIHRCVDCARNRGTAAQQLMGQLPKRRVTPSRAFLHSGVDYAGPFTLLTRRARGAKTYKGFLVVFVCLSTSAVHLDLATDYSTEAFIAAYRRFVSRRGICATLSCDRGTNFVGAEQQLGQLFDLASNEGALVAQQIARDGTKWIFNPPGAPHFGGKWEAAVKSVKFHLRRVIGDSTLTYEEFSTLLVQIEAVLNSRPLCSMTEDPEDLQPLTPGHFLIGSALTVAPEPSLDHEKTSRLSRYQLIKVMLDGFWKRWSTEYIQRLQEYSKWNKQAANVKKGTLVLIIDERYPPTKWSLGRIVDVHPGDDGLCRVATVRTATSTFTRPIVKLCPLPVEASEEEEAM